MMIINLIYYEYSRDIKKKIQDRSYVKKYI